MERTYRENSGLHDMLAVLTGNPSDASRERIVFQSCRDMCFIVRAMHAACGPKKFGDWELPVRDRILSAVQLTCIEVGIDSSLAGRLLSLMYDNREFANEGILTGIALYSKQLMERVSKINAA